MWAAHGGFKALAKQQQQAIEILLQGYTRLQKENAEWKKWFGQMVEATNKYKPREFKNNTESCLRVKEFMQIEDIRETAMFPEAFMNTYAWLPEWDSCEALKPIEFSDRCKKEERKKPFETCVHEQEDEVSTSYYPVIIS
jgi:hypothetical protein